MNGTSKIPKVKAIVLHSDVQGNVGQFERDSEVRGFLYFFLTHLRFGVGFSYSSLIRLASFTKRKKRLT